MADITAGSNDWAEKTEIVKALLKARQSFGSVKRGSQGQYGKYADLGDVLDAVEKPLIDNGMQIIQPIDLQNSIPCLHTILIHESGQYIDSWYPLKEDNSGSKNELQAEGSGISYQRRYALCSLLGINWGGDDDGATARGSGQQGSTQQGAGAMQKQNTESTSSGSLAQLQQATVFAAEKQIMIKTGLTRNALREEIIGTIILDTSDEDGLKIYHARLEDRQQELEGEASKDSAKDKDAKDLVNE